MLRVALLQIAEAAHELLTGNVGVVGEEVLLGGLTGVVDKDVGVSGHTCYGGDHVATKVISLTAYVDRLDCSIHLLVQDVELLGAGVLLQEFACDFALCCENDAIVC